MYHAVCFYRTSDRGVSKKVLRHPLAAPTTPAAGGGLFGAAATPAPAAGGLFGAPGKFGLYTI